MPIFPLTNSGCFGVFFFVSFCRNGVQGREATQIPVADQENSKDEMENKNLDPHVFISF